MPLAPQIYNASSRGDARYDIRGLQRGERGFTDGVYWYDENGLSLDRPNVFVQGLRGSDEMNDDQWGAYLASRQQSAPPPPQEQPRHDLSGDIVPPAQVNPNRVPDAQNPRAVQYALMRLAQLRALGYDFDVIEGDPTATWRNASIGVAEEARRLGYENPRDWLAGRPKPTPRPSYITPDFYDEGDTVAPPASTPRRGTRPSAAKAAAKVVKRPATKGAAKAASKVVKRPATKTRRPPRGAA